MPCAVGSRDNKVEKYWTAGVVVFPIEKFTPFGANSVLVADLIVVDIIVVVIVIVIIVDL
jgi:hypothetical protein